MANFNNDVVVKTTFKDDLTLLKPFKNFYKKIWNPEDFVFYIGCSTRTHGEIIQEIESDFNISLTFVKELQSSEAYLNNIRLYQYENEYYVFYDTGDLSGGALFNSIRLRLLHLDKQIFQNKNHSFYFNTDSDDFFYTNDSEKYLALGKKRKEDQEDFGAFHCLEFVPHEQFDLNKDFEFISNCYFYATKGLGEKLTIANSHAFDRIVFFNGAYQNETHVDFSNKDLSKLECSLFETSRAVSFGEIKNVCFAFGCLDRNYLKNIKHWLQSNNAKEVIRGKNSAELVDDHFNKYYTLTEEDRKNNVIITANELKQYFL